SLASLSIDMNSGFWCKIQVWNTTHTSKAQPMWLRWIRALRHWLGFCLMGMMLTESLCWARFERAGLGRYSADALSWMFRRAKLPWGWLLRVSVQVVGSVPDLDFTPTPRLHID
ncbi:MAG TPA: hypothetical protein VJ508_11600, partial [Saprospiraceae bacterium]|nr:hypothetical protein [Saprospiraceae bacterium]